MKKPHKKCNTFSQPPKTKFTSSSQRNLSKNGPSYAFQQKLHVSRPEPWTMTSTKTISSREDWQKKPISNSLTKTFTIFSNPSPTNQVLTREMLCSSVKKKECQFTLEHTSISCQPFQFWKKLTLAVMKPINLSQNNCNCQSSALFSIWLTW